MPRMGWLDPDVALVADKGAKRQRGTAVFLGPQSILQDTDFLVDASGCEALP